MRIVSLLPSATEIVCGLGLRGELVGVSHCCDYPPEIEGVAVVTRPTAAGSARQGPHAATPESGRADTRPAPPRPPFIDDEIGAAELDVEALRAARPDLVIVRDRPDGSGIGSRRVREALGQPAGGSPGEPVIVSLDAFGTEGVFHSIATVGAMVEAEDDAIELLEALREELGDLEQQVVARRDEGIRAPRVVLLQALEPPFTSGRWVPEQVRRAGGWDLLGREGEASVPTTWESVRDVDPEMLLLAPVGMHLPAAKRAFARLNLPEFWREISAVRRGRVFVVEPVYFERPGPRIVDGVGLLAEIFDPDGFIETSPPASWTPILE
ncbi:MAG: ABC transporter substrate-binding protein [Candidatus Limnocylindrales bacterium]|jgi:iron complex transport system substrate-binding protein